MTNLKVDKLRNDHSVKKQAGKGQFRKGKFEKELVDKYGHDQS